MKPLPLLFALCLALTAAGRAADSRKSSVTGAYHEVTYPPSKAAGELPYGVTYRVWVPDGVKTLRGVIVHQHGCGAGACKGGETAADDLHWQALARKWDCALLGPSYHQEDGQDCRLWCDPRNGSAKAFLRSLRDLGAKSGHPELERAPWCLWGHSGGGFWASLMQTLYPERIAAIWFRSGTAFGYWEKGEIPMPEIPAAGMQIPMMGNPGAKEKGHPQFDSAWTGTMAMFRAYRQRGAPIGFAPDPRTSHECGDSRYLAIPFFDSCLAMRLPDRPGRPLRPVKWSAAWLAEPLSAEPRPAASFRGSPKEAVWLPDAAFARAWAEYVRTGAVSDGTPPPAPVNLRAEPRPSGVELAWDAAADFESGIGAFIIERDGQEVGRLPESPSGRFGRPLFQKMSYHDTPERPLPEMRFLDTAARPGAKHEYRVIAVNSVERRSARSRPAVVLASAAAPATGAPEERRKGRVRVAGHSLVDDGGPFLGLGVSYFTALWRAKHDRPRLERDLRFLSRQGFNYYRMLSMVGWYSAWDGLEIAPVAFTSREGKRVAAWPDYWRQLRDLVDLAYDRYGLRTQVTVFADAQLMPEKTARIEHMRRLLRELKGREHKIILLEVANEAWQNGFPGDRGVADLREFGKYLADRTELPVALSSNHEDSFDELYAGSAADIATWHFSRDRRPDDGWQPVYDCWDYGERPGCPPVSSNEPIGPGSSVNAERDPVRLVMAAAFAYAARLPMYVFHSEAGVFGRSRFEETPGIDQYRAILRLLPPDLPDWRRNDGKEPDAPFTAFAGGKPDRYWPEEPSAKDGCVRNTGSRKGDRFVCVPIGIRPGGLELQARRAARFAVHHPLTGEVLRIASLGPGERLRLDQGTGAAIIIGQVLPG